MSSLIKWIDFPGLGDERGALIVLEESSLIPFEIRRVYYIYNTEQGVSRGFHAHKDLVQTVICLVGSCRMVMDDGNTRTEVIIDSPERGLMVPEMVWHEMHDFSDDCILLVLASDLYIESDYIRNYEVFKNMVSN